MVGLMIVDHGSRLDSANSASEALTSVLGNDVVVAHMELAEPSIQDGFEQLAARGVTHIRVLPLFFSQGRHIREDIPALCDVASAALDITYEIDKPMLEDEGFIEYLRTRI